MDIKIGSSVEVTFSNMQNKEATIRGTVKSVDTNPAVPYTERSIIIEDESENQEIVYSEGTANRERWASVTVKDSFEKLGGNAQINILTE